MTALQNIIKEAKILRAKYPKKYSKWTDYVKAASKNYGAENKKISGTKKITITKKNVNAKIVKKALQSKSGFNYSTDPKVKKEIALQMDNFLKKLQSQKKLGALPIGFKGSILGVDFKVINQFDIYNNVSCIIENTKNGDQITVIDGNDLKTKQQQFVNYISYYNKDNLPLQKQVLTAIDKFLRNLNIEVKKYNSGNKATTKKKPIIIKKTATKKVVKVPSNKNTITKIKETLRKDKKRLTGGYKITPGNVRMGAINLMAIDDFKKSSDLLNKLEKVKINYNLFISNKKNNTNDILIVKKQLINLDKYIAELKIHNKELKKII